MMDLSDGLASDLPRLTRASQVGFEVDLAKLPLNRGCSRENGLQDGEDYELLFAVPPSAKKRLAISPALNRAEHRRRQFRAFGAAFENRPILFFHAT